MASAASSTKRKKFRRVLSEIAPQLAGLLGGPLAGAATGAIAKAILGREEASIEEVETALLAASPDQLLLLRQANHEFVLALEEAQLQRLSLDNDDRANARAREQALADPMPAILGGVIIAGFFVVLTLMMAQRIPDGAQTEFSIMLGALSTMTAAVVNYYFGSSVGSKKKTQILAHSDTGRQPAVLATTGNGQAGR